MGNGLGLQVLAAFGRNLLILEALVAVLMVVLHCLLERNLAWVDLSSSSSRDPGRRGIARIWRLLIPWLVTVVVAVAAVPASEALYPHLGDLLEDPNVSRYVGLLWQLVWPVKGMAVTVIAHVVYASLVFWGLGMLLRLVSRR